MASGTYLTDPAVLRRHEVGLAALTGQGFAVADVIRAYQLLYSFTVGFCIEEQAVAQAGARGTRWRNGPNGSAPTRTRW